MKVPNRPLPISLRLIMMLLTILPTLALADWSPPRSGKVDGARPYTYTVMEDLSSPNQDVVYVLHGAGMSDEELSSWAQSLGEQWAKLNYAPPRLVSVSFGELWMLVKQNESDMSGLLSVFLDDVMHKAETQWLSSKKIGHREVMGFSMGGMNTLLLAMAAPEKFTKFVALSPSLLAISPLASENEIARFSERHGIPLQDEQGPIVGGFLGMIRAVVPTEKAWSEINPAAQFLTAGKRLRKQGSTLPSILISTGDQDTLFFSPSHEVAGFAQEAGFPVTWLPVAGAGHEVRDKESVARFLMN